jgi:hypothetical protein
MKGEKVDENTKKGDEYKKEKEKERIRGTGNGGGGR